MNTHLPKSEIIQRVFLISPDKKSFGSCFAYLAKDIFYLITAAHVIASMKDSIENDLHVFKDNQWNTIKVTPYFIPNASVDMAVIKTSLKSGEAGQENIITLSLANSCIGQDVYFLGFPYCNSSIKYTAEKINSGYPLPFVKKAVLSRIEHPLIFLDGHSNPGFSGGPVIGYDFKLKKHKVLGIIFGYLNHTGKVKPINNLQTEYFYKENSGIAIACNIKDASDLIDTL